MSLRPIKSFALFFALALFASTDVSGAPQFFDVRAHGAQGDKSSDATQAIQSALDACGLAGGGTVYVPPGDYVIGPIFLRSGVELRLEAGATLWATTDKTAYFKDGAIPTTNHAAGSEPHTDYQLINGEGLRDIALTGRGTIHGRGAAVWWGKEKFRPWVLSLRDCENVLLEGITTRESPTHTFSFRQVTTLRIRGISVFNDPKSPNTDGFALVGCRDIHISEVTMDTGDDCITVHGGTSDLTVVNSSFRTPWGFLFISNGRNITIGQCVVQCQTLLKDINRAEYVVLSGIIARGRGRLFSSIGGPARHLTLTDVIAYGFAQAGWLENAEDVVLDNVKVIREPGSGAPNLADGFEFRNISGLTLRNVELHNVDVGPALIASAVTDLEIDGFKTRGDVPSGPGLDLRDVRGVFLRDSAGRPGQVLARFSGAATDAVRIGANDLRGAVFEAADDVPAEAIIGSRFIVHELWAPAMLAADTVGVVTVVVENPRETPALGPLNLSVDGATQTTRWVWLGAGERREVALPTPKLYTAGVHTLRMDSGPEIEINVPAAPARIAITDPLVRARIVKAGTPLPVTVRATNVGTSELRDKVRLHGADFAEQVRDIALAPGESVIVEFAPTFPTDGIRWLAVNGVALPSIKVYTTALDSLVLDLDFENSDARITRDASGLGYDATFRADGTATRPAPAAGPRGTAMHFDGNGGYLEIPEMLLRHPMTLTCWMRADGLTSSSVGGRQMIVFAGEPRANDGFGPEHETHLALDAGDFLSYWTRSGARLDVRTRVPFDGKWRFIAVVLDRTARLYVDGVLVDESPVRDTTPDYSSYENRLLIGRVTTPGLRYFNGMLDSLRIYHEPLSAEAIAALARDE